MAVEAKTAQGTADADMSPPATGRRSLLSKPYLVLGLAFAFLGIAWPLCALAIVVPSRSYDQPLVPEAYPLLSRLLILLSLIIWCGLVAKAVVGVRRSPGRLLRFPKILWVSAFLATLVWLFLAPFMKNFGVYAFPRYANALHVVQNAPSQLDDDALRALADTTIFISLVRGATGTAGVTCVFLWIGAVVVGISVIIARRRLQSPENRQ